MFTTLVLTLAIGTQVSPPTAPVTAGTAPRVMELKPDANGKITFSIVRIEMQKVQVAPAIAPLPGGGGAAPVPAARESAVTRHMVVELGEVKDLTITTADGKKLDKEEAIKKLTAGAIVVVSGDGKPVGPAFLKVFKDETLVLASPELIVPHTAAFPGGPGMRPALAPGVPPPVAVPVQPGVIPIAPGGVVPAVVPAPPQAQPAPVAPVPPAPVGKPVTPPPAPVGKPVTPPPAPVGK
jgi:hypothetical protein